MAKKHGLPQQVIDFISTHHGKSRVEYFYLTCKNENHEKEVDEHLFTYPGIPPYSKETAIVMMADSIEAASRSLKEITEESVSSLVNKIINKQIEDNHFNHADLTFRDISRAKEIFKNKILSINHARVEYPKEMEMDKDETFDNLKM
jgi:membrane-associated HD superfamily phosphohydrolase